jgi:hypothetical protein
LNCLTWSVIADLWPFRVLVEASLNHIVQDVDFLNIEMEPATCPPSIVVHLLSASVFVNLNSKFLVRFVCYEMMLSIETI